MLLQWGQAAPHRTTLLPGNALWWMVPKVCLAVSSPVLWHHHGPLPTPRQASLGEKAAGEAPFSLVTVNSRPVPTTLCTFFQSVRYSRNTVETNTWCEETFKAPSMDKP